jgi:hypothetical protein
MSTRPKKRNSKIANALQTTSTNSDNDNTYQEFTPFIEHKLSKTLRRVLKYSFRSVTILAVLLFSTITISAVSILFHYFYCWYYEIKFAMTWFEIWMLIEAVFLVSMNFKYRVFLSMSADHLPKVDRQQFDIILNEFKTIDDMSEWIEGWFFRHPWDTISYDDLMEWTSGQFFNDTPGGLSKLQLEMAFEFCDLISSKLPAMMPPRLKQNPLKKILLTLDTPAIYHRPLVYYVVVRVIDRVCRLILNTLGFKSKVNDKLPFYLRTGPSKEPPIVFFHGLGIGLTAYLPFVTALVVKYSDRNIVLFEMPSIQMKLDENHVLPKEFASHVNKCLLNLGFERNIIIGHSLGTACVRWMDLYYPELVIGRIFVDPIVFSLWTHEIAHNAIYRDPSNFHEAFLKYIGMAEPGHATFLHRYFCWFQNTYFTENLPENTYIFLSEKDNIVDTPVVARYLVKNSSPKRKIVVIKAFRHGQILASPEVSRVVMAIETLSQK